MCLGEKIVPMQNMLLPDFKKFVVIILICLSASSSGELFAQFRILDDLSKEITFSSETEQSSSSGVVVPLTGIDKLFSQSLYPLQENQLSNKTISYLRNEHSNISIGKIKLNNLPGESFSGISLVNESPEDIGSVFLSFDFLYQPTESTDNHTLKLKYRMNDGQWVESPPGVIETSTLGNEEGSMNSFSVQLTLDDIYVRNGDILDAIWVIEDNGISETATIPLFLQRIEVDPVYFESTQLSKGELVITEVMPNASVDGYEFEYIEVYNPDNSIKSLKGFEIKSSSGSYIIQKDVVIEPYSLLVLSNADLSDIDGVGDSYFYPNKLLQEGDSRIEFIQRGELVSSITFEPTSQNTAFELQNVSSSVDGYTSFQNLEPSSQTFFLQLKGSPGKFGRTVPLFKKRIETEGVHFLSIPGRLPSSLNRLLDVQFYDVDGTKLLMTDIEPYKPVFVYKEDSTPTILIAEEQNYRQELQSMTLSNQDNFQFISSTNPGQNRIHEVEGSQGFLIPPIVNKWDQTSQTFSVESTGSEKPEYWVPFLTATQPTQLSQNSRIRPVLTNRLMSLSLYQENGNEATYIDKALIGFIESQGSTAESEQRYDIPKAISVNYREGLKSFRPVLYVRSKDAKYPANAFTHISTDIKEMTEIPIGFQFQEGTAAGASIMRWQLPEETPNDWVVTLRDQVTGSEINMKEASSYRFRRSETPRSTDNYGENRMALEQVESVNYDRFVVQIHPPNLSNEVEEEEVPGRVELKQNYPNPFNPSTNISFYLPEERQVRVGVYNIVGQQVATLIDDNIQAGEHSIVWDASNNPSGIYIVQLETANKILTRKITLVK